MTGDHSFIYVFILFIMDMGSYFNVMGFIPSIPGDFLLSKPLNAAIIFSSFIQSLYLILILILLLH